MRRRGIIVFHPRVCIASCPHQDIAFGHNFDLIAQMRRCTQGIAEHLFCRIAAIDIRLIHGRDALRQTGLDFRLHMARAGVGVICQAPHAINQTAQRHSLIQ